MNTNAFEQRIHDYLDGLMTEKDALELLVEVQSDPAKKAVFEHYQLLQNSLKTHAFYLAPALRTEQMLAARIPVLGEMNPLLRMSLAASGIGSKVKAISSRVGFKWIVGIGCAIILLTGGSFLTNVFHQDHEITSNPVLSERFNQRSSLEQNRSSASSNAHSSLVNPKASHADRFIETDQHSSAQTSRSHRSPLKSLDEGIVQATTIQKEEESPSAFDQETTPAGATTSLETFINAQPLGLNIPIATSAESPNIYFSPVPIRNYSFTPFPAKLSGVAVSFAQGMTGGGFGGSFGESRALREAYRLGLSYKISRSFSIGVDYGKMTMLRKRLSYDAFSNHTDQTNVFIEKSNDVDFSTTHTDVMLSFIINPNDVLFFHLNGSIGTTLSGKPEPIFSLGPGIGYWINSYVAATLDLNYRGAFLSPEKTELPTNSGNPVGIIKNMSGNSSLSSSVEIRFGFGFTLW